MAVRALCAELTDAVVYEPASALLQATDTIARMFDEPSERPTNPADRAKEKFDEFRMHAEVAAVFEAARKFDARILPKLDPETARDVQRTIGRLEKAKLSDLPVIAPESAPDAARLLTLP